MRSLLSCAAAAVVCLLAFGCPRSATAQSSYTEFFIPLAPSALPWPANNQTQMFQGANPNADLGLVKVFLGPCTYRMMHYNIFADELLVVTGGRLVSALVAPNNTVFNHILNAGDNIVYPKGWLHYQSNPTCRQSQALISFNARNAGTVNVPLALTGIDSAYLAAALNVTRLPDPMNMWVVDKQCARSCGIKA